MQSGLTELKVLGIVPFGHASASRGHFALRLSPPAWPAWQPGQFIMLRPASFGLEIPWGRPFSICHTTSRHLICFFRVEGRGTKLISELRPGDPVHVWGPLGRGFAVETDTPTLLLAGGMGIAPFVGYVARHPQPWNLGMLFGHRDPPGCYPVDNISEHIQVDSLREHEPGDLDNFIFSMQEKITDCAAQNGLALACGPMPFLRAAKELAAKANCRLQISIEKRMACGVGACLGCVCKPTPKSPHDTGQPIQTCLHGPVFWADEIEI
ncbi:MAG: dihydroorotate dehydrogenase electron transfer subunit [Desulfovibrio sp.]|nr:dihydroorotate dehydrogenase electron transfer subunit [Desulfovibrio sp.]